MGQPIIDTTSASMTPRAGILQRWAARGFSAADLLNALQPRRGWQLHADIPYRAGPRGLLDVYAPADQPQAPAPTVVFFYGGSWQSGARDIYRFVGASLAAQGIVTVVPDYGVYPQARYPEFLEDAAKATRFIRDNAARWNANPAHIVAMGHSAGAYIAAMLAFDGRWLAGVGLNPRSDIAGFVGLAGPYDFLPIVDPVLQDIFGGSDRIDTQPIRYVGDAAPPSLLIAPGRDKVVSPGNTTRLAAHIRSLRGAVTERHYARIGHLGLIGAFSPLLRFLAPVFTEVAAFARNPRGTAKP
ncbi:MAG: alpha/beta hydrolase [Proteobacteria bacterium]|nr:alpha/beta hydrolase [Pseudomonadota bacterium]